MLYKLPSQWTVWFVYTSLFICLHLLCLCVLRFAGQPLLFITGSTSLNSGSSPYLFIPQRHSSVKSLWLPVSSAISKLPWVNQGLAGWLWSYADHLQRYILCLASSTPEFPVSIYTPKTFLIFLGWIKGWLAGWVLLHCPFPAIHSVPCYL